MVAATPTPPTSRAEAIALGLIIAAAALLRLPLLGTVPNGLFLDEAARGYDAYALLVTGADQFGVRWPLFPEGLDDYTPVLYTLSVIPSVAVLGLTETAVRLPSALAGLLTVVLTFLSGRLLFGSAAGLVGAALVAISPWHILPSRTGAEWNLLPLFVTAGVWLLLRGRTHGPSLLVAGMVLGIGLYSYAFARLLVPLLLVGFAALWWRDLLARWRWSLAGAACFIALALPMVAFGLTPEGQARLQTVVPLDRYRGLALVPYAASNFLSYFGPGFLIWGSEPTHHHRLPGFGPILLVMVPLVLAGLAAVVRQPSRASLFCLWWIVAAPASAALHRESPSSALLLGAIPAWQLFSGFGAGWLRLGWANLTPQAPGDDLTPQPPLRRGEGEKSGVLPPVSVVVEARCIAPLRGAVLPGGLLVAALLLTAVFVARSLYIEYPVVAAEDWLYGARETVAYLEAHRDEFDGVLVSDRLPSAHILVLFYAGVDPRTYQQAPIHVRQPAVRARGEIGPYAFGRTQDLLDRPGRYLLWLPGNEDRTRFGSQRPALDVSLPDGRPAQVVYEVQRR